jgi:hypothetical protein
MMMSMVQAKGSLKFQRAAGYSADAGMTVNCAMRPVLCGLKAEN